MRQTGKFDSGAGGSTNSWVVLVGNLVLGTAILLGLWAVFFFFFGVSIWMVPSYFFVVYFGLIIALVEIKKITGVLKKYFLFVANGPIYGAFITAVYCLAAVFIAVGVAKIVFGENSEYLGTLLLWGIAVSAIIFIALAVINKKIVKSKITILHLERNQIALVFYTSKDSVIVFYETPLWGEFPHSIIQLPDNWGTSQSKIKFLWKIIATKTRTILIPVTIKFAFSGPFQAQDYRDFLPTELSPEIVILEEGIKKAFFESIFEGSQYHTNITNYLNGAISDATFLDEALSSVRFLLKLFPNVKETKIKFGEPKIVFEETI